MRDSIFIKIKFYIFSIFSFFLVFTAVLITVLNTYKPLVKVYVDQQFMGYFSSKQQFDEVYTDLVYEKQKDDQNVKVFLESEPTFEDCYVRGSKLDDKNIYSNLRTKVKTEYIVYNIFVNDKNRFCFNVQDDVNDCIDSLKKELPKLNIKVKEEKISELANITSKDETNKILNEIIKENKPLAKPDKNKWKEKNSSKKTVNNYTDSSFSQGGVWPTTSRYITSRYGWRWGTIHTGTDIAGRAGDPIYAYKDGTVTYSGWANSYGNIVKIDHGNGFSTWYAHNSKLLVRVGQNVTQGQKIALMGSTGFSTGNHVHFEVRINGIHVNSYPYIAGK